jgi:UDP-2-acetamido-2,6-beta-L-arabino-hexul-4-ose reductase
VTVLITGGHGFLGWHTACRLRAQHGIEAVRLGREAMQDHTRMTELLEAGAGVIHLAGVNRAESGEAVRQGNVAAAEQLADAVRAAPAPVRVVYANSVQSERDNPYGVGKVEAARILADAVRVNGGSLADVILPNLFGEHGRPAYNSFVATFCHLLATGGEPSIDTDDEVPLLHAQAAAEVLISALSGRSDESVTPAVQPRLVSEVLAQLREIHELYGRGDVPPLTDRFAVDLFHTYRSYAFPAMVPVRANVHSDARGDLMEITRSHGGTGQTFVSTTQPGATRGEHYHLHKVERFFVVKGTAEIALRRLLHDEVITFTIDGSHPGFVDMPTMWVHNIKNVGREELMTIFWTDQLLDPERPDQYAEQVRTEVAV